MLRLRLAIGLALICGVLTLVSGLVSNVRWLTVFQRTAVSVVLFSSIGYLLGKIIEIKFLNLVKTDLSPDRGQPEARDDLSDNTSLDSSFSPFTSDSFERIKKAK